MLSRDSHDLTPTSEVQNNKPRLGWFESIEALPIKQQVIHSPCDIDVRQLDICLDK